MSEDFLPQIFGLEEEYWNLARHCLRMVDKFFLHISTASRLFMTSSNFFRSLFWIDFCRGIDLFSFVCSTHCISQSFVLYFVKQEHFIVSIQFNVFGQTPFYAPITVLVNLCIIVMIYTAQQYYSPKNNFAIGPLCELWSNYYVWPERLQWQWQLKANTLTNDSATIIMNNNTYCIRCNSTRGWKILCVCTYYKFFQQIPQRKLSKFGDCKYVYFIPKSDFHCSLKIP